MSIPSLLYDDIRRAVESAIQFGVSADDFRKFAAQAWYEELTRKRDADAKTFTGVPT